VLDNQAVTAFADSGFVVLRGFFDPDPRGKCGSAFLRPGSETGYRVRILYRSHTTQLHRLEIASRVKGAVNGTYEMVLAGRGVSYWGVIDGSGETESRIE
jgi:hypothetical protein